MKFIKQTQYSAVGEIDWSNSLTNGLQFCYNADIGDIELVRRIPAVNKRTASINRYTSKYGYTAVSGVTFGTEATYHMDITSGPLSVFACGWFGTLADYATMLSRWSYTSESVNSGWIFQLDTALSGNIKFANGRNNATTTAGGFVLYGPGAVANSRFSILAATSGSTSKVLYVNGKSSTTAAGTNQTSISAPGASMTMGSGTNLYVGITMVWTRQLSLAESVSLYENPHQIFRSKVKYLGIPTYNITSYSGTVAKTLSSPTPSISVTHPLSATVNRSLVSATGNIQSFFNQTDNVILLNQSYPVTNGNSYAQISDGTLTPQQLGTYYVGKSGTIGYGFAGTVDYDTVVFVEKQPVLDQKLFYSKTDFRPIVSGGTYST